MAAPAAGNTIMKELFRLMRDVDRLTDGQVRVYLGEEEEEKQNDDDWTTFYFDVRPNDGYYKGGKIKFKVEVGPNYPEEAPEVNCCNAIYHPNIDLTVKESEELGSVCVNLLSSDWSSEVGLDGCIMAILFLFYHPQLDDPLSPLFTSSDPTPLEEFAENVKMSMRGEDVDDVQFDRIIEIEGHENEIVDAAVVVSDLNLNKGEAKVKVDEIEGNDSEANGNKDSKEEKDEDRGDQRPSSGDNESEKMSEDNVSEKMTENNESEKMTEDNESEKMTEDNESEKMTEENESEKMTEDNESEKMTEDNVHTLSISDNLSTLTTGTTENNAEKTGDGRHRELAEGQEDNYGGSEDGVSAISHNDGQVGLSSRYTNNTNMDTSKMAPQDVTSQNDKLDTMPRTRVTIPRSVKKGFDFISRWLRNIRTLSPSRRR